MQSLCKFSKIKNYHEFNVPVTLRQAYSEVIKLPLLLPGTFSVTLLLNLHSDNVRLYDVDSLCFPANTGRIRLSA